MAERAGGQGKKHIGFLEVFKIKSDYGKNSAKPPADRQKTSRPPA